MGLILLLGGAPAPPAPPAPPVELASDSFTVEVEFTTGVWTTIGEVASLEIKRGKNHELSRMERGWATLLIRNDSRNYDPDNSASIHAGNVLPMKRMRVRSEWDGTNPLAANLLTENQASLEIDTTGWAAESNCTIVRDGTFFLDGAASLAMTAAGAGAMYAWTQPGPVAVTVGQTYTAVASFRPNTTARNVSVILQWRDGSGASVSQSGGPAVMETGGAWTQASVTAIAPAGAASVYVMPEVQAAGAGEVHYVDQIGLGSSTFNLFQGFIRGWPQSWEMGLFQQVLLRAEDAFAVLALAKFAGTLYTHQLYTDTIDDSIVGSNAAHYYLDEVAGGASAGDRVAGFHLDNVSSNVTFGSVRPPTFGRPYSVEFGPNNSSADGLWRNSMPAFAVSSTNVFAFACWFRLDSLPTDGYVLGFSGPAAGNPTFLWRALASGAATTQWLRTGGAPFDLDNTFAGVFAADGAWHHYAVRVTIVAGGAGTGSLGTVFYRDGAVLGSDSELATGAESINTPGQLTAPNLFVVGGDGGIGGSHGIDGNMAQLLVVTNNAPSGTQLQELGTPVFDHFPAEPAGLQIHSILDGIGWPSADRDINDGTVVMEAYSPQIGDGALEKILQLAEDSERGLFYAGGDGKLYFKDAATLAALVSTATFGNTGSEVHYETVETRSDDQDIWNQIEVTAGAYTAYEEDAVSISLETGYGPRLLRVSTVLNADADADTLAAALLARYKDPYTRPVQLTLYAHEGDTDILEQIFGLKLGQRVTVIIRPPAGGDPIALLAQVEGIQIIGSHDDVGVRAVIDLGPYLPPNLLTENQADLETDTTGWDDESNCSIVRDGTFFLHGGASLAMAATGAGAMYAWTQPVPTAVTPGNIYTAMASFRPNTTARTVSVIIQWRNSGGASISQSVGSVVVETTGVWRAAFCTATAPVGAASAYVMTEVLAAGAGETHYVDQIGLMLGSATTWRL